MIKPRDKRENMSRDEVTDRERVKEEEREVRSVEFRGDGFSPRRKAQEGHSKGMHLPKTSGFPD